MSDRRRLTTPMAVQIKVRRTALLVRFRSTYHLSLETAAIVGGLVMILENK